MPPNNQGYFHLEGCAVLQGGTVMMRYLSEKEAQRESDSSFNEGIRVSESRYLAVAVSVSGWSMALFSLSIRSWWVLVANNSWPVIFEKGIRSLKHLIQYQA